MSINDIRRARAYLLRATHAPAPAITDFVADVGPIAAAEQIQAKTCPVHILASVHTNYPDTIAEDDLTTAERLGMRLIIPEDTEWPHDRLNALTTSGSNTDRTATPLGLWARGPLRLDDLARRSLAIVGCRAATGYGEHHAAELAHSLAQRGVTIWTGASYGIEGAASRGALAAGTPTVAILGWGIDAGYPAGHTSLLDRIADTGLVPRCPSGTPPSSHAYPARGRPHRWCARHRSWPAQRRTRRCGNGHHDRPAGHGPSRTSGIKSVPGLPSADP